MLRDVPRNADIGWDWERAGKDARRRQMGYERVSVLFAKGNDGIKVLEIR
jgi:hypothetical protein